MIYGSSAKGNYRNGSDIDLTIVAPALTLSDLLKRYTNISFAYSSC
ncbi:MAG: nucleotidyltransferase domain-containing protein [Oligoflexia bacterium]|nr:nucleotidyltransferase domain-containing protein [Oligoflexia bacterium]